MKSVAQSNQVTAAARVVADLQRLIVSARLTLEKLRASREATAKSLSGTGRVEALFTENRRVMLTQSEVATRACVSQPSASRILRHLVAEGRLMRTGHLYFRGAT